MDHNNSNYKLFTDKLMRFFFSDENNIKERNDTLEEFNETVIPRKNTMNFITFPLFLGHKEFI